MTKFPPSIQNLIDQFNKLPGIGPKTAEKLVFYLLKQSKTELTDFAQALEHVKDKITICSVCQNIAEKSHSTSSGQALCYICSDPKRDKTTVCVAAEPQDMAIIESTGEYRGLYHLLGGTLNTLEGITPDQLKIKELLDRLPLIPQSPPLLRGVGGIKEGPSGIKEIILAFNPDLEGETTILYLTKILKPYNIKITRLARGLPMGSDLIYADEATLSDALKGRREI